MLKLENIHKTFHAGTVNQKIALDGLSLTLNDGDFVTVIGGNGAGKSTLLNTIAGTFPVDQGRITIDGEDITDLSEEKRARFLGRVFQDPMMGTAADMWIEENMALAANAAGSAGPSLPPIVKISAGSSRSWTWGWRIVFPPRSACFPAASGRRLPCLWPL